MRWVLQAPDKKLVEKLQDEFDTSAVIAVTMANRGITSRDSSRDFFDPTLSQLHDPFIMKNMDLAVARILTNIQSGRPIMVFGDYDVDGTTAASTREHYEKGAFASRWIKDRSRPSQPGLWIYTRPCFQTCTFAEFSKIALDDLALEPGFAIETLRKNVFTALAKS